MGKGRFLNQKLGKRTGRRLELVRAGLQRPAASGRPQGPETRFPKKGPSRATGQFLTPRG